MIKEGDHCALHNAKPKPVACKYFSSRPRAEGRPAEGERRRESLPLLRLIVFPSFRGAHVFIAGTLTGCQMNY